MLEGRFVIGVRMSEVSGVTNQTITPKIQSNFNFRSAGTIPKEDGFDSFVKEQEEAKKKAKKQQKFQTIFQISFLSLLAASLGVTLAMAGKQFGWFKKFKLDFKNLSNEKGLSEMALPESQKLAAERVANRIEHYDEIIRKGGKQGTAILFYGPPGTGKNTFAYAIAKKFPNARFLDMDISKMNSMWHGESEKNILGTIDATVKYADSHPNEKIFVFLDEIDSVMMQDRGNGAKLSQDILNAFKKGFNQLTNKKNIVVMGATNLHLDPAKAAMEGKMLDTAMVDRFAQKVLVDLPTKSQIQEGIKKFYENPSRGMIASDVRDFNNPKWDKIAEFLSNHERGTSFRKLTDILGTAAENTKIGKEVTFEDIIKAIQVNKENLHATDKEIEALIKSLK